MSTTKGVASGRSSRWSEMRIKAVPDGGRSWICSPACPAVHPSGNSIDHLSVSRRADIGIKSASLNVTREGLARVLDAPGSAHQAFQPNVEINEAEPNRVVLR